MSQLKLEVVNLGTTTLDPSGVDGYTEEFSISPTAIPKLAPGAKTLLTVSFRPKGVGIRASLNAFIFGAESHSFHVTGIGVESPDYLDVLEPGEVVAMGGSFSVGPAPRPNAPPVGFINGMVDSQQKYQWLRNGKPIRGATEATLSVSDAKISDGGQYDVIVSNEAGRHRVSITFVMVVDQTIRTRDRVVRVGQKATVSALTSLGRDANIEWKVDEPQTWLPYSPHVSLSFSNTGRHAISATISSVIVMQMNCPLPFPLPLPFPHERRGRTLSAVDRGPVGRVVQDGHSEEGAQTLTRTLCCCPWQQGQR
jgi:hypothetical protein